MSVKLSVNNPAKLNNLLFGPTEKKTFRSLFPELVYRYREQITEKSTRLNRKKKKKNIYISSNKK